MSPARRGRSAGSHLSRYVATLGAGLLLACLLGIGTACRSLPPGTAPDEEAAPGAVALAEARAAVTAGAFTAAEAAFRDALDAAPNDPAASLGLADLYLAWSRPDDGLAALEVARARGAPGTETLPRRMTLLLAARRWDEAGAVAEQVLADGALAGEQARLAHATLTEVRLQQGACAAATVAAREHVAAHPDDPQAARTLALLEGDYATLQAVDPAMMAGLATCDGTCDQPVALRLVRAEAWGLAACLLSRVVMTDPTSPEGHTWLGEVLTRLGRLAEAEEHLRQAVTLAETSPVAWLLLGKTYLLTGDLPSARVALLNAQRLDPNNPAPCLAMAELKARMGAYDEVDRWIDAALVRAPHDTEIAKLAARFYLERNLVGGGQSLARAQEAVALAPDDAEAHTLLGWAQVLRGDPEKGLASLDRALALNPDWGQAHYLRARALQARGAEAEADQALIRAADLGVRLPEAAP